MNSKLNIAFIKNNLKTLSLIFLASILISPSLTLLIPNVYTSESKVSINKIYETSSSAIGGVPQLSFGNVFGLESNLNAKASEGFERITSRIFFRELMQDPKFSSLNANFKNNKDFEEMFRDYKQSFEFKPSDGSEVFYIYFSSEDPEVSQKSLSIILDKINSDYKAELAEETSVAINYLTKLLSETENFDVRQRIIQLLSINLTKNTVSNIEKNTLFKIIDPPNKPFFKSFPNRPILSIIIFLVLICVLFTCFLLYISFFSKNDRT